MPFHSQMGVNNNTSRCDICGHSHHPPPECHQAHPTPEDFCSGHVLSWIFFSPLPLYQSQARLNRSRPGTHCLESDTAGTGKTPTSDSELPLQPTPCPDPLERERGTRGSCNPAQLGSAVPSRFTRIRLDSAGGFPDGTTQGDRAPGPRGPSRHTASGQAGSSWATSLA